MSPLANKTFDGCPGGLHRLVAAVPGRHPRTAGGGYARTIDTTSAPLELSPYPEALNTNLFDRDRLPTHRCAQNRTVCARQRHQHRTYPPDRAPPRRPRRAERLVAAHHAVNVSGRGESPGLTPLQSAQLSQWHPESGPGMTCGGAEEQQSAMGHGPCAFRLGSVKIMGIRRTVQTWSLGLAAEPSASRPTVG